MAWRAARSLPLLHRQLQTAAPRTAPRPAGLLSADEWGLIGDALHDPESDHAPHDFPGWGDDIVTAGDFPNRPDLGLDAFKVLDNIRLSRDPRVKYAISNGRMYSSYGVTRNGVYIPPWTWREYNPRNGDRHFTHGHLSVVGDSRADDLRPWQITAPAPAGAKEDDDDMGQSFAGIAVQVEGFTSFAMPPANEGAADPRPAWVNAANDTGGADYGLRFWYDRGKGWEPLAAAAINRDHGNYQSVKGDAGRFRLASGERLSAGLPDGTYVLSVTRVALGTSGEFLDAPTDEHPVFSGHLTIAVERGPVKR